MKRYTVPTSAAWESLGTHVDAVPSTNDYLQAWAQRVARSGEVLPQGTNVRADYQSAGKGRLGRQWEAAPGENLTVSYLLDGGALGAGQLFALSQCLALCVRQTVDDLLGEREARGLVKWPNDVYVDERKVAGLLVETALGQDRVLYVVAGVGLNVNQESFDAMPQATSLRLCSGRSFEVSEVWRRLTANLQAGYAQLGDELARGDAGAIAQRYHTHLLGLGVYGRFRETASGRVIAARVVGVSASGHLRLVYGGQDRDYSLDEIRWEGPLEAV